MKKVFTFSAFVLILNVLFFMAACNNAPDAGNNQTTVSEGITYEIKSDNVLLAKIVINGSNVTVDSNGKLITSENKGEKRKYYVDGDIVYEIKYKDGGFKLRTKDGELLWKIKVGDDKIKISDNELNNNAYELKLKEDIRCKVVRNDEELGNARWNESSLSIEVDAQARSYSIQAGAFKNAFATLIATDIEFEQQCIIIAELLTNGAQ